MAQAIVGTGSYGRWQIVVTQVSQNRAANTSQVRVQGIIYNDGTGTSYNSSVAKSITSASSDGSWSGSGAMSVPGGGTQLFIDQTFTVEHGADGNKTVSFTANLGATGTTNIGGPTSVSVSLALTRIVQLPTAPSAVTATRSSDTSIAVGWTRNVETDAPYDGESVWVKIDGATEVFVANVSATATTHTYAASANHEYQFIVKASNAAGTTPSAASSKVLTTPAALASLSAALITSGTIRLTLGARPTPHTDAQVLVEETHDGGATWNTKTTIPVADLAVSGTTTWDDTAAETGGTVQYRTTVQTTAGTQGTLSSAVKVSNTLVLNTPPNQPTGLAPSGPVDASRPIRLEWTHNPSSDGASQSSRKIEYSTDGGSTTTSIVAGNSTLDHHDWTPTLGDFTAGQTITWRVATAGSQPGTYGDWSEWQTITLYGSLAVTLVADNPPTTHVGGPLPVAWTSSATWGTATQTQYQVTLTDDASGQVVYDTGMVTGATESIDIPSAVQVNGRDYTVEVTLRDNHQVTSEPVTRSVTMDYLAPGPVTLTWLYDDTTGQLVLYPTFSEETSSAFDDTASWLLERSLDGTTWTEVGSADGEWAITDPLVRVGAASQYRTTSFTALGVAGEPTVHDVPAADVATRWGWLNYGDQYTTRVRFGWSQTEEISPGRASESNQIEGVDYPVPVFGANLTETFAIAGKLLYGDAMAAALATATADEMRALAKAARTCIFRDADGEWLPARVFDMKLALAPEMANRPQEARVSFTIERVAS